MGVFISVGIGGRRDTAAGFLAFAFRAPDQPIGSAEGEKKREDPHTHEYVGEFVLEQDGLEKPVSWRFGGMALPTRAEWGSGGS
jgi:hypothetical protein